MKKPWLALIARVGLALLFLAAGLPKVLDPAGFALTIFRYQMLPEYLINLAAVALPWLEIVTALFLLGGQRFRSAASVILLALLLLFTAAISVNIFRGIDVACGCFTTNPDASRVGWSKVALNFGFIAVSAFVWRTRR